MSQKLDVLLVTPPSRDRVFQGLAENLTGIEPPVWSTLMATFLRQNGVSVKILDAEAESIGYDATADKIVAVDAVLTVFVIYGHQPSASTQCMPAGREVCVRVQERVPQLNTLVMGTHASALPARTLSEEPYKFVCCGEGPETVCQLVGMLKAGSQQFSRVPGLWYWSEGVIYSSPNADNLENLDLHVPGQAWDLLDMSRYRAHNWHCFDDIEHRQPYASLQTSLGCPYKCSFCCINAPFGGSGIRYWSPKLIVDQIDVLVNKYSVKNIKIPDEMFVLSEQHVLGICDLIIERGYNLNIWAYARVDTVKDRYLEKLKRAGFNWLALGVESGSKYVRDGVDKGRFGDLDIVKVTDKIKEHEIYIIANYIFGLPDDTQQSMQETLSLAQEINAEWANFYCAMAYPGSPLYERAKTMNSPLPDDAGGPGWIGYSQHGYDSLPLNTDTLRGQDILDFRDEAFEKYFGGASFLSMIQKKFGQPVVDHIHEMMAVKLKRKHRDGMNPFIEGFSN
jgi:anaerobic magnesium-protoporphyrin IX monomethyl ester cyclase